MTDLEDQGVSADEADAQKMRHAVHALAWQHIGLRQLSFHSISR
jgi:hypothetical protein